MKTKATVLCFSLIFAGCTEQSGKPDSDNTKGGADGKSERWGSSDDPALFSSDLNYTFAELPEVGEATLIPWAGSYWPVYEDSINKKWDGGDSLSPAAKFGEAFGIDNIEDAVSADHGIDAQRGRRTTCTTTSDCNSVIGEVCSFRDGEEGDEDRGVCIPTWWGICHAWAPVAILQPEPKRPVTVNGVEFKIQDIKALATLAYDKTSTRFVSLRCNDDNNSNNEDSSISFDKYGRPTGRSSSCKDTNPGTFHVLITNYLGVQGQSFVYDRTFDDEVWNQPIRGYRIKEQREVSVEEAHNLLDVDDGGSEYIFNSDADKLLYIRSEVDFISESPSERDGNLGDYIDQYTHVDRYEYILELENGEIIGGEWVGSSKTAHPDFAWLPIEPRGYTVANGKIRISQILDIVNQSIQDESPNPGPSEGTDSDSGDITKGQWKHYGPFTVAEGGSITAELNGNNDADLYVRKAAAPSATAYDCRPYQGNSQEQCTLTGAGEYYVAVNGYAATSAYSIDIRWSSQGGEEPGGSTPDTTHLDVTDDVARGESLAYEVGIEAGQTIRVRTFSNSDVDLYIQQGSVPTTDEYLMRAYTTSGNETITYTASASGSLHIVVHGYEAGSFTLKTSDN